jgi:hypothetical protein
LESTRLEYYGCSNAAAPTGPEESTTMTKLPTWMRVAMLATAVMNIVGAISFVPSARRLREMGGFPAVAHPLYLSSLGAFILIFGLAYLWAGVTGRADRMFVSVGAAGKLAFFALLVRYWAAGLLDTTAVASGTGDLVFGVLFLVWLVGSRGSAPSSEAAS